jgi:hypothetical protein
MNLQSTFSSTVGLARLRILADRLVGIARLHEEIRRVAVFAAFAERKDASFLLSLLKFVAPP